MDNSNNDVEILVEFEEAGVKQTGIDTENGVSQSKQAIERALKTVTWLADKSKAALQSAHHQPTQAEIEFGIKVGTKAGILVTQADAEFHIKVTLIWKNDKEEPENDAD